MRTIIDSGNGIHCYWRFKEAFTYSENHKKRQEDIDRIEAALKLLCDLVGGDMKPTQPSAVMRLVGSHNTKHENQNHLVTIIDKNDNVFELDDLEEWLSESSPSILRKVRPETKTAGQDNSYSKYAESIDIKSRIDVDKRLGNMMYMGGGDSAIHTTQVAVSASLLQAGVDIDEVVEIIFNATVLAAGEYGKRWNWTRERRNIRRMCETWLKKRAKDGPKKQRPKDDSPHGMNGAARPANNAQPTPPGNRPFIRMNTGEHSDIVNLTEQMLIDAGVPLYQRGGSMVRPIISEVDASHGRRTKTAQLEPLNPIYMRDLMCRHCDWYRFDKRAGEWVRTLAPIAVANTLLARKGDWHVPTIVGCLSCPTLRPDGSLLTQQGFDPTTRLLLVEPPPMPPFPHDADANFASYFGSLADLLRREDALQALALLKELLVEFPFVDNVSRAVALSGIITPIVRGAFPVAPMHVARAAIAGSGKSFLWDIVSSIAAGQLMPVMATGANEEELEKRLGASLVTGQPLISIDNVNGELGGAALCEAIEPPIVDVRILGKTQNVRIESRGTSIFCTGKTSCWSAISVDARSLQHLILK